MDESPDIRLRRLCPDDAPAIAAALSDGRVARTTATIPEPYSLADAVNWLSVVLEPRPRSEQWAIERHGALVGVVALQFIDSTQANVSYWIAPTSWGQGLATAAVKAAIGHARRLGLRTLSGRCLVENRGSARVLEKAGFVFVAERMGTWRGAEERRFRDYVIENIESIKLPGAAS